MSGPRTTKPCSFLVDRLSSAVRSKPFADWEHEFAKVGLAICADVAAVGRLGSQLQASKPSTRTELTRRVRCGVDFMLSSVWCPYDWADRKERLPFRVSFRSNIFLFVRVHTAAVPSLAATSACCAVT